MNTMLSRSCSLHLGCGGSFQKPVSNKEHNLKEYVDSSKEKKKLIADKTREPGKCWKVSGTLFEVRAAEPAARHLQDINTCRGQPVFFGEGIWEYVSLKKHSCVYTHSRVHARRFASMHAHTLARARTHFLGPAGVLISPRGSARVDPKTL